MVVILRAISPTREESFAKREHHGRGMTPLPDPRRRAVTWIVGGVIAALAIAATVLAVGLLINLPTGTNPTPSPSMQASESTAPSAPPQPSASASDAAGARLMQVTVDRLRMRTAASTTADVIRIFDPGEVVRFVSGPVESDGYTWYEVEDLDSRRGWAAMGGGGEPWLEDVPPHPGTSELLLRLERNCDVGIRDVGIPVVPADLALTADGRVVLISGVVRQLSPSGLAQMRRDVLQSPYLQTSATYDLELLPGAEAPGHGACVSIFTLGEGAARVVVTAVNWQGDEEEASYWVPSPARRALDELTTHLFDIEAWLGAGAWSEPVARRYVSGSYLFWLTREGTTPPPDVDAPSMSGAAWPFDGPIDAFGEPVGQERCGYLDLAQAFETLRLMRARAVPTYPIGVDAPPELRLDGFGSGTFATDAGWFSFWLTPRSPDSYPACTWDS